MLMISRPKQQKYFVIVFVVILFIGICIFLSKFAAHTTVPVDGNDVSGGVPPPSHLVDGQTYPAFGTYHAAGVMMSGMNSFTSESLGISFAYPKRYLLFEKESNSGQYTFHSFVMAESVSMQEAVARAQAGIGGEGPESVVIAFISNPGSLSLGQWVKSANSAYTNYHPDDPSNGLSTTSIAGLTAFKYHSDLGLYATDYVAFQKRDQIVLVSAPSDLRTEFNLVLGTIEIK
jgi:hypothetical protein